MKNVLKSLVLAMVLVLGACAKDNGGGAPADVAAVPQATGTCTAGQVNTQYGCVPQGTCPANYGLHNNQCIPVTTVNGTGNGSCVAGQVYTQYGCIPQGNCGTNSGYYNNVCIQAYANTGNYYGNGGSYNAYYYQNRTRYYGNGGGYYYGNPYAGGGYYGNGGVGIGAGFYIGGRVSVPGMYYGY
jgi:hypothetical protein